METVPASGKESRQILSIRTQSNINNTSSSTQNINRLSERTKSKQNKLNCQEQVCVLQGENTICIHDMHLILYVNRHEYMHTCLYV